jgi:hypothetical protein
MREDEGFVYYDVVIKDLSNKTLDILVEDGQIKIAGTIVPRKYSSHTNYNNNLSARDRFAYFFLDFREEIIYIILCAIIRKKLFRKFYLW